MAMSSQVLSQEPSKVYLGTIINLIKAMENESNLPDVPFEIRISYATDSQKKAYLKIISKNIDKPFIDSSFNGTPVLNRIKKPDNSTYTLEKIPNEENICLLKYKDQDLDYKLFLSSNEEALFKYMFRLAKGIEGELNGGGSNKKKASKKLSKKTSKKLSKKTSKKLSKKTSKKLSKKTLKKKN
jgi:hypothetical protein